MDPFFSTLLAEVPAFLPVVSFFAMTRTPFQRRPLRQLTMLPIVRVAQGPSTRRGMDVANASGFCQPPRSLNTNAQAAEGSRF